MSMTQWYLMVTLLLTIFAIGSLFIGLRGVATRRPFLISGQVVYLFNVIVLFVFLCASMPSGLPLWAVFGPFVVFLIVVLLRGSSMKPRYLIYGTTSESFQKGLLASLTRLNLPCEETPIGWWLPAIVDHLEVTAYPLGGRVLKMKQRRSDSALHDIAKAMNE